MSDEFLVNNTDKSEKWLEGEHLPPFGVSGYSRLVEIKEKKGLKLSLCIPR